MTKLKTLDRKKFTLLYNAMPVVTLAKELDVDENPLMNRARKYGLKKRMGRPWPTEEEKEQKAKEKPNPWGFRYSLKIMDILIEALIFDGASDERLLEKGYPPEYIKKKRAKYGEHESKYVWKKARTE